MGISEQLAEWALFINDLFSINVDRQQLTVPVHAPPYDRLIVVPKQLGLRQLVDVCRHKFGNVYCFENNIDEAVKFNERPNDESYAVWVRSDEAPERPKTFPADQLRDNRLHGITLMERLLLELKHFDESGQHLDVDCLTLCSGSRNADNSVPYVCWNRRASEMRINWLDPDETGPAVRSRVVVC